MGRGSQNVENDCYSSQLNMTVSSEFSSKTVECAYDNGVTLTSISAVTITVLTGINLSL